MPRTASARRMRESLRIRPIPELDEEEQALAKALAGEFERLTTLVAEEDHAPEYSMAARVLTEFHRLGPRARDRIRPPAPAPDGGARPAARAATRQGSRRVMRRGTQAIGRMGESGGRAAVAVGAGERPGAVEVPTADPFEVNPAIAKQVRALGRKRLEAIRPEIMAAVDRLGGGAGGRQAARLPGTTVDLKLAGEVDTTWRREIHVAWPEMLDFRWKTQEPEAERGYWELRGPVSQWSEGPVIASGFLPDNPAETGIGGYFTIPLRNHLPPTAPQMAMTYHVRVLPLGRARRTAMAAGPQGIGSMLSLQPHEPVAPDGIGPWSPPAVIRYGRSYMTPPTEFDIENISVYRKAHFFLDWFKLVQDQPGPGNEEFHIAGFVMQQTPQSASVPLKIGPFSFSVDPDDRSEHRFGRQATFHLGTPNITLWPKVLLAVISIMEEDDGGSLNDWHASLADLAQELMSGALAADINAFLREMLEEIKEKRKEMAAELAAETAAYVSALIAATAREVISAFIAVVVAWILAFVRAASGDDFYGTQVYGLTLATNDDQLIRNGKAGDIFTSRVVASGGEFTGSEQPDGSFRLSGTELQFIGLGGPDEGSPTSGIVNIMVHWEFDDKVDV